MMFCVLSYCLTESIKPGTLTEIKFCMFSYCFQKHPWPDLAPKAK